MKKVIHIIALLIGATTMAQTITVNGTPMLVSDDISFPFWLESGSSISPEVPVSSISVLEFNIIPNNNGNDMVFNQVISVTEGQTVPEGKTWKVESILMENQEFVVDSSNTSLDSAFVASMISEALSSNQGSNEISNATVDSIGLEVSNLDSLMQIITPFFGCTDPTACNYDSIAVIDNRLCEGLLGCMDNQSENYNPFATCDDGSCIPYVGMYDFGGVVYHIDNSLAHVINIDHEDYIGTHMNSMYSTASSLTTNGFYDWQVPSIQDVERICTNQSLINLVANLNDGIQLVDDYYLTTDTWCNVSNQPKAEPFYIGSSSSSCNYNSPPGGCPGSSYRFRTIRIHTF